MSYKAAGKYVRIDINHPRALGVCDQTGFIHNKSDLVKQMVWRGDSLEWNGFLVGKDFVDKPNEQGRAPYLPPDPVPVPLPRPKQGTTQCFGNNTWPPLGQMEMPFGAINGGTNATAQQINTDGTITTVPIALYPPEEGNLAMTGQQRLQALQNFNWSGS